MTGINGARSQYEFAAYRTVESQRALSAAGQGDDKDKLKEVCRDFEAIFVKQMLDSMRKTVHKGGMMGEGGMAEDIFEDMLYDEYAKNMTKNSRFGIADALYKEFTTGERSRI
jgi:flagellar protein FlgJ